MKYLIHVILFTFVLSINLFAQYDSVYFYGTKYQNGDRVHAYDTKYRDGSKVKFFDYDTLIIEPLMFEGAEGYGTNSRAAYEVFPVDTPSILIVDDLTTGTSGDEGTGRGSLYWALSRTYPRIIVFEVGGLIDYDQSGITSLLIDDPYLSVYGQTAPSPGIIIKGVYLSIQTQHVLLQHLKFRTADDTATGPNPNSRDNVTITTNSNYVVIDHCSFEWSLDENLGVTGGVASPSYFTFSNNIFAEPLYQSLHYSGTKPERHAYNALTYECNASFIDNLFAASFGRNPLHRPGNKISINNFTYSTGWVGTTVHPGDGDLLSVVVSNVSLCMGVPEFDISSNDYAVYVTSGTYTEDSRLYVEDNLCELNTASPELTQWECVQNSSYITQAETSPLDLSGYTIMDHTKVEDSVLTYAGAFFWDRDTVDQKVVDSVAGRNYRLVSSPDSTPARGSLLDIPYGDPTYGDLSAGKDFSVDKDTIIINIEDTIVFEVNCPDIDSIVGYLNGMLPDTVICVRMNGYIEADWVAIQTVDKGEDQILTIGGADCLTTFGIPAGTYHGRNGIGWNFGSDTRALTLPTYPHDDDDGDGYRNIEEWVKTFESE